MAQNVHTIRWMEIIANDFLPFLATCLCHILFNYVESQPCKVIFTANVENFKLATCVVP